jgi:hypothetical protein
VAFACGGRAALPVTPRETRRERSHGGLLRGVAERLSRRVDRCASLGGSSA